MDYSEVSCDASEDKPSNVKISLKYGKPVYRVTFNAIQFLYTLFILDVTLCIIGAIATLTSSVQVGRHLGHFINLVSNGDGNLVPILEGIPSFLFIVLNIAEFWALWKIFEPDKYSVNMNRILFILILISLGIVLMVIIFMIVILVEIYRPHGQVHDGIIEGMNKYANHSLIKATIDMVQIEFDCCGSKKYDEWYTIPWYEGNIADLNKPDKSNGNTPFSCCSRKSLFPCIHHDIENTGETYLYVPERNLSISTNGCHTNLLKAKIQFGWNTILNLFALLLVELIASCLARFIQTAHFGANCFFEREDIIYTIWIFGLYRGKIMVSDDAPEPPPLPSELIN